MDETVGESEEKGGAIKPKDGRPAEHGAAGADNDDRQGQNPGETQNAGETRQRYNVHVYAIAIVKVCGVAATSQEDAIKAVEAKLDLYQFFDRLDSHLPPEIGIGYGEETHGYLVDEVGDETFERSQFH